MKKDRKKKKKILRMGRLERGASRSIFVKDILVTGSRTIPNQCTHIVTASGSPLLWSENFLIFTEGR